MKSKLKVWAMFANLSCMCGRGFTSSCIIVPHFATIVTVSGFLLIYCRTQEQAVYPIVSATVVEMWQTPGTRRFGTIHQMEMNKDTSWRGPLLLLILHFNIIWTEKLETVRALILIMHLF